MSGTDTDTDTAATARPDALRTGAPMQLMELSFSSRSWPSLAPAPAPARRGTLLVDVDDLAAGELGEVSRATVIAVERGQVRGGDAADLPLLQPAAGQLEDLSAARK
jgi:hypothetical protein